MNFTDIILMQAKVEITCFNFLNQAFYDFYGCFIRVLNGFAFSVTGFAVLRLSIESINLQEIGSSNAYFVSRVILNFDKNIK